MTRRSRTLPFLLRGALLLGVLATSLNGSVEPEPDAEGGTTAPPAEAMPAPEPKVDGVSPGRIARPSPGDTVKLIFTSGDAAEGRVVSVEPEAYVVRIGGLHVTVRVSDIQDLVVLPPLEERFRQMRAIMDPKDADTMSALANWCFERGLYDQALEVLDDALKKAPNDADLQRLRDMMSAQIELARLRRAREARQEMDKLLAPEPERGGAERMPKPYPDFPLLSEEQVNLLKVYEVDLRHPPRILIDRETVDTLVSRYSENPLIPATRQGRDALKRWSAPDILGVMFRVQARELYSEVRVVGHPESMRAFRDDVHAGWLINNCATNRCHGGEDARDFILFNRRPSASRSFYTNFLIIERYRTADRQPLIDYLSPDRSLLLQMGLERSEAITPHPDVFGWKPVFRSRDSRAFQRAVRWIESMYRPRPEHPIDYVPPGRTDAEPRGVEEAPEEIER